MDVQPVDAGTVNIDIKVVDSATLIPRPMIKYSTELGLTLGLKVDYLNAFGTLTDQMLQGYWSPQEVLFEYRVEKIVLNNVHMGLDVIQKFGTTRYGDPTTGVDPDDTVVVEYENATTEFTTTFDIPLDSASPWFFQIEPVVSGLYSYEFIENSTSKKTDFFVNDGFAPGINAGFYTDQVDWIGNLRKGFYFDFMSENLWYTGSGTSDLYLESDLKAYLPITPWFEISGRIGGFHAFTNPRRDAGDRLRGVVDYMVYGDNGAFFSLQTNFRIIDLEKKIGGLGIYLRPFTDIGYVNNQYWTDQPGNYSPWEYCVGATAMFYFKAMPSLTINVDWGWDLKRNVPELIIDTVQFL